MRPTDEPGDGHVRRLAEELADEGLAFVAGDDAPDGPAGDTVLRELLHALRPPRHERRIASYGAIVDPRQPMAAWAEPTQLAMARRAVDELPRAGARRFADGLSSWLVLDAGDAQDLVVFDRAAGSERDLVVLAAATGGTLVQRHPSGTVRVVGAFGVVRWDGTAWHHEPSVRTWIDTLVTCAGCSPDAHVLTQLLEFAVHDLGARGVGALLVHRPADDPGPTLEQRLPTPPPLEVTRPADLAPLRHVLAQVDGAAVFDESGTLRQLGVRLVPSAEAEADVAGYRGMRHTAGRRYSFDDPLATVIVVSEDGPVTVLRNGELLGRSEPS
jgi:hypothetical protein